MSACALRRWGTGTSCGPRTDTPASKEMAAKLAAMQAERQRQDAAWGPPAAATEPQPEPEPKGQKSPLLSRKDGSYMR